MPKFDKRKQAGKAKGIFLYTLLIKVKILVDSLFYFCFADIFFKKNAIVKSNKGGEISNELIVYNVINKEMS